MNVNSLIQFIHAALQGAEKTLRTPEALVYLERASEQLALLQQGGDNKEGDELSEFASRLSSVIRELGCFHSANAKAKALVGK